MTITSQDAEAASTLQRNAHHAWRIRRFAQCMGEVQDQSYVGQALGWADVPPSLTAAQ